MNQQALEIYRAYPRRVARPVALRAIEKALREVPFEDLLAVTKRYAEAYADAGSPRKYTPHPATWFNQARYDDDAEEWFPSEGGDLVI
jgi:hypothetical protein